MLNNGGMNYTSRPTKNDSFVGCGLILTAPLLISIYDSLVNVLMIEDK